MSYKLENGRVIGVMPNGKKESFGSYSEYEDAYYDQLFELNNGFELDYD